MYHMVLAAPNQEEIELLQRVDKVFALKKFSVSITFASNLDQFQLALQKVGQDYIFLSCAFSTTDLLEHVSLAAEHVKESRRVIPLIYLLSWKTLLPTILGTAWSGQVGILHTHSSNTEIMALFQRLDGWGEVADQ